MATLGWTLLCQILGGLALGWGLDWLLGTDRVFLIIGVLAGILVGMTGFIRTSLAENRRMERIRKNRKK
jgi:F0F1-type ATP synthase assembly protein I